MDAIFIFALFPLRAFWSPICRLFRLFLLYSCCTIFWGEALAVFKPFPLFKDSLFVDVRVMRDRPVRVPAYLTNFRHRIASFQKSRNAGVFGLMEPNAAQPLALGLLVNRFTKGGECFPVVEDLAGVLGFSHDRDGLGVKGDPTTVLPLYTGNP